MRRGVDGNLFPLGFNRVGRSAVPPALNDRLESQPFPERSRAHRLVLLSQTSRQQELSMAAPVLDDPTKRYPKPPYKKQSQPWPGLASKMEPRPDHGETSYKGSGRLQGR